MKDKFIHKYMRLAKQFGEDSNPCLSRHIGVVIVDPVDNNVAGIGYNGPPPGTPHCDTREYLGDVVWPQLTDNDKLNVAQYKHAAEGPNDEFIPDELTVESFLDYFSNCGTCPRRIVGAASGQRLELCSCEHAEKNAIYNSSRSLVGTHMFCWCGVPCWDCSKAIIRSGVSDVYYYEWGEDYSSHSRWLLTKAGVILHGVDRDEVIDE